LNVPMGTVGHNCPVPHHGAQRKYSPPGHTVKMCSETLQSRMNMKRRWPG